MAVTVQPLSPWPDSDPEQAAAIVRFRREVAGRTVYTDEDACHLGAAASAMIEKEAPGAPQAIKDEAVIRFAGYLSQSDFGGVESETSVGGKEAHYFKPPASAFRYSGSKGLLAPWRVRGALVMG